MEADENVDWRMTDFAKRVVGASQNNLDLESPLVEPTNDESSDPVDNGSPPAPMKAVTDPEDYVSAKYTPTSEAGDWEEFRSKKLGAQEPVIEREARTASAMADIILDALRSVGDVPERGFQVTVYGSNPWNAMLTIKPEAGPVRNAELWRTRVQDIGVRLRQDFDLIYEPP